MGNPFEDNSFLAEYNSIPCYKGYPASCRTVHLPLSEIGILHLFIDFLTHNCKIH